MSEAEAGATKQPDPTETFRELRDAYLDIWSKNLIDTVNSEGYAKASGAALDGYLAVAAPFKEPAEQAMLKMLQQLNMPTSADFAGLAGRLTNVEMLLDNLDAKLDRIEKLLTGLGTATSEKSTVPMESADAEVPMNHLGAKSSKAPEAVIAPRDAKKATQKRQTALRVGGNSKRTANAKPVRHNPRKATR